MMPEQQKYFLLFLNRSLIVTEKQHQWLNVATLKKALSIHLEKKNYQFLVIYLM